MPQYIAAYDTENPSCLAGVRQIVKMHEKYEMPATFFLVAERVDKEGDEYCALLRDHPLFEIASHSYTHALLREHRLLGWPVCPAEQCHKEIVGSKQRLEDFFGCEVTGFRTPCGFDDGLRGAPELLELCSQAGYNYVSSLLWGPDFSLPALIVPPFTYAAQGFPRLWELPGCGWHENLLKGQNEDQPPMRCQLFPSPMPEAMAAKYIETPEEEFALNCKTFIDRAIATNAGYISLIWHPWSLHRFDPEMRMLNLTFSYVREKGLPAGRYAGYAKRLSASNTC